MADTVHMMAQEHMALVDALRYGSTRNAATISAALAAIGSNLTTLVLTFDGDGIWTLASNVTIPVNVTLWIPPNVYIQRNAGVTLTIQGNFLSFNPGWQIGPGSTVLPVPPVHTIQTAALQSISFFSPTDGLPVQVGQTNLRNIQMITNNGSNSVLMRYNNNLGAPSTDLWDVGMNNFAQYIIKHGAVAHPVIACAAGGVGLSNGSLTNTPTHLLHLFVDDAFKPGDGTWDFPSDARIKTTVGVFPGGLSAVQALPAPVVYTYNGKANTPQDGTQYVGMIAQDVQPVAPYLIKTYQEKLEPEDAAPTTILAMNDSPLLYMLVNAIKELAARVESLEGMAGTQVPRVEALETAAHTHTGTGSASGDEPLFPSAGRAAAPAEDKPAQAKRGRRHPSA